MFTNEEILKRLQKGESAEDIIKEATAAVQSVQKTIEAEENAEKNAAFENLLNSAIIWIEKVNPKAVELINSVKTNNNFQKIAEEIVSSIGAESINIELFPNLDNSLNKILRLVSLGY